MSDLRRNDRTIHAKFTVDREVVHVVRYDRAGKWFLESPLGRRPVTLEDAVLTTLAHDNREIFFGRLGGSAFDRRVRREATRQGIERFG